MNPDDRLHELDQALKTWGDIEPSASLQRAIARVPHDHPRTGAARSWFAAWVKPFALSLVAGIAGVCVGLVQAADVQGTAVSEGSDGVTAVAAQDADSEWQQLQLLASGEAWPEEWDE